MGRGFSILTSLIILAAATLSMAIFLYLCYPSIASLFTTVERLRMEYTAVEYSSGEPRLTIDLKNTGETLVAIQAIRLDGQLLHIEQLPITIYPGSTLRIIIMGQGIRSGKIYKVEVITEGGKVYTRYFTP